ncbi:hypothetical protein BGC_06300 [Burkholderia sp. 3C]
MDWIPVWAPPARGPANDAATGAAAAGLAGMVTDECGKNEPESRKGKGWVRAQVLPGGRAWLQAITAQKGRPAGRAAPAGGRQRVNVRDGAAAAV